MRFLLLILIVLGGMNLKGQTESCGTMHFHKKEKENNPVFAEKRRIIKEEIAKRVAEAKTNPSLRSEEVYTIPVVVHVIHLGEDEGVGTNISDAQINSAIQQLNDAFSNQSGNSIDIGIQFELASIDPNCEATTGINRVDGTVVAGYENEGLNYVSTGADDQAIKALSKWPNTDYYNIWVVSEIDDNDGGAGIQGYAYFPGASSAVDGTMIMNTAFGSMGTVNSWNNQGKTLIHEMGHALDLYHTFEGDNDGNDCPSGGCGSDLGDCCDDTEIHKRSSGCPTGVNECTGVDYAGVQYNYMDYSNQTCRTVFTEDQKLRMRTALEVERSSLLTSRALSNNAEGFLAPIAASCEPTTSAIGLSANYAGIMNFTFNERSFPSSTAKNDNGYLDRSGECLKLIEVTEGETYDFSTVVWVNTHYLKVWIDYDNNGIFNNTNELIHSATVSEYDTSFASVVIPTDATENESLRMRVMVDLQNPFNDACWDPNYGQAEDYVIYINPSNTAPVADYSLSSTSICVGESIQFTDESSENPDTWTWSIDGPESIVNSTQNPELTFNTAGNYSITLTVENGNGSDNITTVNAITVNANPAFDTEITHVNCAGASDGTIAVIPSGSSNFLYSLDGGMNLMDSVFLHVNAGTHEITLTDGNNCTITGEVELTEPDWSIGRDTVEICNGEFVEVHGSTVTNPGEYTEFFLISSQGCDSSHVMNVIVNDLPEVSYSIVAQDSVEITEGVQSIPEGEPAGGYFEGTGVSGNVFDPEVAGNGIHQISYFYEDPETGCENNTAFTYIVYTDLVGINENSSVFKIYPNPGNNLLNITAESDLQVKVYSPLGELLINESISGNKTYDTSSFAAGLYLIQIQSESNVFINYNWIKEK